MCLFLPPGRSEQQESQTLKKLSLKINSEWLETSCCRSVPQSRPTLQLHDCSTPGFPVLHYLSELAQTHVHQVSDAIQPSHLPVTPLLPALHLSQHQGLFQWVGFSHQVAKILELQHQSFRLSIQGWFPLGLTSSISLLSKGLLRVFSSTTIRKHQFFGAQPFLWFNSHICTWLLKKP